MILETFRWTEICICLEKVEKFEFGPDSIVKPV